MRALIRSCPCWVSRLTRRQCLHAALASAAAAGMPANLKLGAVEGCLMKPVTPEVFSLAARLGLDGVELSLGTHPDSEFAFDQRKYRQAFLDASQRERVAIAGLSCDVLHFQPLRQEAGAVRWLEDAIRLAAEMRVRRVLLPFFGKGRLDDEGAISRVGAILSGLAPQAARHRICLGLENTLSAAANMRLLDRIGSDAVRVYYDVGNSTNIGNYDAAAELRLLGRSRLCQIHLKDKGYLGEGRVNVPAVFESIRDIGYEGFLVLETPAPSGNARADLTRNMDFVRQLWGRVASR